MTDLSLDTSCPWTENLTPTKTVKILKLLKFNTPSHHFRRSMVPLLTSVYITCRHLKKDGSQRKEKTMSVGLYGGEIQVFYPTRTRVQTGHSSYKTRVSVSLTKSHPVH